MPITKTSPQTAPGILLSQLAHIRRRYLRSVHLERDFYAPDALEGYLLTSSGISAARRICPGITAPYARAFTLTGPYGTGKSAFVLFASHALATLQLGNEKARTRLIAVDSELASDFAPLGCDGFWPVLVTGARQSVALALLRGLGNALSAIPVEAARHVEAALRQELDALLAEEAPDTRRIVALYRQASRLAQEHDPGCRGIMLVIDELGKLLEYAAAHPDHEDIHSLQEVAEYAVRSSEAPLIVLTILHQAFEEYAQKLGAVQRAEWQKVQGRFADIPFGDAPDETIRLIGEAIEHEPFPDFERTLSELSRAHLLECQQLKLVPNAYEPGDFRALLQRSYPLHPLALMILPHVFRRFGQSERTLFSFLSSDESHGFQNYLKSHSMSGEVVPLLDVADVYDYIVTSLGSSLYSHPTAKLWSETEEALFRSRDRDALQIRLIKTIGLLSILGESTRVLPSLDALSFALSGQGTQPSQVEQALSALVSASLVVYRRFRGAYRLYEGSDVDIDARIKDARTHFTLGAEPIKIARRLEASPPIVARRHSFRTGTLRFFQVGYCRASELEQEFERDRGQADGLVLLCLASNTADLKIAEERVKVVTAEQPDIIVGLNVVTEALHQAAGAVETLLWVRENTPELRNDRIAARELSERILEATEAFCSEWERLLQPQAVIQGGCLWYYRGEQQFLSSNRDLQRLVSRASDQTFPTTPKILNELVNRRQLSSTAAAARRNLLEGMIERKHQERLGITGFPPEFSMYSSVLEATGIHRQAEDGSWAILPPTGDEALQQVWQAMEDWLFEGELRVRGLTELNDLLRARPFGLADGLIPLLICALLVHYEDEIAVYEEGRFVTDLSLATFGQMINHPEDYKIQGFRIAGERQAVINRFAAGLLPNRDSPASLETVAREIYRQIGRLTDYALKTRKLDETSLRVRDLLREAKEPEQLLLLDLPRALGARPFTTSVDDNNVRQFFERWNTSMSAVMNVYPALLCRIEGCILRAFDVGSTDELRLRCKASLPAISESRLKAFVTRAADDSLSREKWLESAAAALIERPPFGWNDQDEERFENLLLPLAYAFAAAEDIRLERQRQGASEEQTGLRLAVARGRAKEISRVVFISEDEEQHIDELVDRVAKRMEGAMKDKPKWLRLAAIAELVERALRGELDG